MDDYRDSFARKIRILLEDYGIDPLYAVTVITVLIALSYRKELKEWDKIQGWRKGIVISTFFGASVLVLISLLRLVGVIEL